ncbi:hypothetical protein D3C80_1807400 [compost metagenome]
MLGLDHEMSSAAVRDDRCQPFRGNIRSSRTQYNRLIYLKPLQRHCTDSNLLLQPADILTQLACIDEQHHNRCRKPCAEITPDG